METKIPTKVLSKLIESHCSSVWLKEMNMRFRETEMLSKYAAGTRKPDHVLRHKGAGFEQIYEQCMVSCGSEAGLDVTERRKSSQNPHYPLIQPQDTLTDEAKQYVAEWQADHKKARSA